MLVCKVDEEFIFKSFSFAEYCTVSAKCSIVRYIQVMYVEKST